MIGSFDFKNPSRRVLIVGGGVAGLMAAVILDLNGYEVTLIEKNELLGGMLATEKTSFGIAEHAAHSFLATPRFQKFCQDLGVELIPVNKDSQARFILRNAKFRRFPLSIWNFLKHFSKSRLFARKELKVNGLWTVGQIDF